MNIELSKQAVKTLSNLDLKRKTQIIDAIKNIPKGDVKPLKGCKNYFRLRVGDWRIVFCYKNNDVLLIAKIAPRGDVYKGGL